MRKHSSKAIRHFILGNIDKHSKDIARIVSENFGISRQSVNRYLQLLEKEGSIESTGKTRNKRYLLKPIVLKKISIPITPGLEEDKVWRQHIEPLLKNVKENVKNVCHYGFTEMFNNIIDHSDAKSAIVEVQYYPNEIRLILSDNGVGIFNKITQAFNLEDHRHAILELSKGKLTTDPERHTGEGIFFTSRMFDEFSILSGKLFFTRGKNENDGWLVEASKNETETLGTLLSLSIAPDSTTTASEVFSKYTNDELGFTKTHVLIELVAYGEESLVSRSQAKRLLARLEKFKEVFFDFRGVKFIGQAFADQIFRIFRKSNPDIKIAYVNANEDVEKMIKRSLQDESEINGKQQGFDFGNNSDTKK